MIRFLLPIIQPDHNRCGSNNSVVTYRNGQKNGDSTFDPDRSSIQEYTVKIHEKIIVNKDIISVITVKQRLNGYSFPTPSQQFFQRFSS